MSDLKKRLAEAIWTASRADEGTISATGANIVVEALMPLIEEAIEAAVRHAVEDEIDTFKRVSYIDFGDEDA